MAGRIRATASPTYSIALQGNQARLDFAQPVGYGLQRSYPDFATQPYSTFENNEQIYRAVLKIGLGRYEIKKLEIDDTALSNSADVEYTVVGPGNGSIAGQALVNTAMVTAPEVASQDIRDIDKPVGPFSLTKAGTRAVTEDRRRLLNKTFASGLSTWVKRGDVGRLI